ncbi:MAG: hypothetical protein DA328_07025 [Nitrososphaeraceae archaeon]|nr:hypothetical protein [Nitrososphaeraceae archaeon]
MQYTILPFNLLITTYAQENEAEVEADIEQENECKKDTECKNENELNNQLSILNITQATTSEYQATLNVTKIVQCQDAGEPNPTPVPCEGYGPEDFTITVTGNNPYPSQFPGSSEGTLVTLGAGDYEVNESVTLGLGTDLDVSVSGDCTINQQEEKLEETIEGRQSQICTITNLITFDGRR